MFNNISKTERMYTGSVSLVTVVLLSAILIVSGLTVVFSSIDLQKSNLGLKNRIEIKVSAKSCFEESMNIIKDDLGYTGTYVYNDGDDACNSVITSLGGGISSIDISVDDGTYVYEDSYEIDVSQYPPRVVD